VTEPRALVEEEGMARDPRFDVLFEPVKIGPVTAPNRFYQADQRDDKRHQSGGRLGRRVQRVLFDPPEFG
jgi:hypothetical protein